MKDILGFLIIFVCLFGVFVSGFYLSSDYFESRIKKTQAIYINDVEYRCDEIKR